MSPVAKIKETLLEHIVLTALGVIGLLLLVIWRSVDPAVWVKILNAVPKQVLWAWLGLASIVAVLEGAYIFHLQRQATPKLLLHLGVLWDKKHNLYCPKDETPLFQSGRSGNVVGRGVEVFKCPKCDNQYTFKNDDGSLIYYKDAKEKFSWR